MVEYSPNLIENEKYLNREARVPSFLLLAYTSGSDNWADKHEFHALSALLRMLGMELEHNSTGIADAARDLHNPKSHGARITDKRHDQQVRQSQSSATGTVILFARGDQNCAITQEWDQATDNSMCPFDPVVRTP